MKNLGLKWISVALSLALSASFIGCEVDDEADASGTESSDGGEDTGSEAGDEGEAGEGSESSDEGGAFECDDATQDCEADGYCCFVCFDSGTNQVTDPDCNPNTPETGDGPDNDSSPDGCSCDYWGFVCEAGEKCTQDACTCDPDCTLPNSSLTDTCVLDGHCDTWCPTAVDPDCEGSADDGKYCE
jgi:hypothetical protein